jgi:hypothetical protein
MVLPGLRFGSCECKKIQMDHRRTRGSNKERILNVSEKKR